MRRGTPVMLSHGSFVAQRMAVQSAATQLRSIARYLEDMLPEEPEQPPAPQKKEKGREKGWA